MHLVVDDMTCGSEIDRVDDFIITILFIAIEIFGLATVTYTCQCGTQIGEGAFVPE